MADPKSPPANVASVNVNGKMVPYIVRIETGTVNRSIYQIAMLHDPAKEPNPDFLVRPAGWNGKLIYTFGGGCEPGWYQQGASTGGIDDDVHLRGGYAVASASLDVAGNNCNDLISAETMIMVKERFIEHYGVPMFTIGWGSSGGAIQQHGIADNYPGLLDGLITGRSFADTALRAAQAAATAGSWPTTSTSWLAPRPTPTSRSVRSLVSRTPRRSRTFRASALHLQRDRTVPEGCRRSSATTP